MASIASVEGTAPSATSPRDRALAAVVIAIAAGADVAGLVTGLAGSRSPSILQATHLGPIGSFTFAVTALAVGVILRAKRPGHPLGWTFLWLGLTAGVTMALWGVVLLAIAPGGDAGLGRAASWLGAVASIPVWSYVLTALMIRFPGGEPATPADARLLRWAPVPLLAIAALSAVRPGPLLVYPAFDNPIVLPAGLRDVVTIASTLSIIAGLAVGVLAVRSMAERYRRASSVERHQLRWFAFAGAVTTAGSALYVVVGVILFPDRTAIREVTFALFIFGASSLPIAVLIAITRYRLYEIDRIIGRTVAYGALTAILAGLYAASVRLFNALFVALTDEESEAALVMTTLVLATTFTPIKGRLEKLAASRFPPEPEDPEAGPATLAASEAGLPVAAGAGADDLDGRIEAIARRVAEEVLADREGRGDAAAR